MKYSEDRVSESRTKGTRGYRDGERPIIELRHINKLFGGVLALDDVNLKLFQGEVVAIVGDNGAGKSTLMKVISGLQPADSGEFWFEGELVEVRNPTAATALGIQTVYQDLALCDNLDVIQNLFLGHEEVGSPLGVRLNRPLMEQHADRVLRQLGMTNDASFQMAVSKLSGGQRQVVAVSRSVLWDPRVVLLDEPTASLAVDQRQQVADLISRLRSDQRGVVVVSHDIQDFVAEIADRIVVLRLGRKVAEFTGEINIDQVLDAIIGSDLIE